MSHLLGIHNNKFSDSKWFEGGKINIAYNCIDRHLKLDADKIALIWEGDDPEQSKEITYAELHLNVCKFSNILKNLGVIKGSRSMYLYANDPRSSLRNAGVCKNWRHSLSGVWRVLPRITEGQNFRCRLQLSYHSR